MKEYIDRWQTILGPDDEQPILAADHTKKLIKRILKNGTQVYDGYYTVMTGRSLVLG